MAKIWSLKSVCILDSTARRMSGHPTLLTPTPLRPQICHKQYQTAMQMEEHLSSYDHHHRKRMAETRAMLSARTKKDREKKAKGSLEKELAKLTNQCVGRMMHWGLGEQD